MIDRPASPANKDLTIAIIGAGLGGLALALYLHKAGLTPIIFELRSRSARDGGYLALAPNALAVLDDLDIYQSLLAHGFAYENLAFLSARNTSRIGGVLNGSREKYGYPALRISRHILRQTLLRAVEDAGIEVNFERKVIDVNEIKDSGVWVTFKNHAMEYFDYVIGADGIHSRIRKLISDAEPTFSGQMGIGGGSIPRSGMDADTKLPLPCMLLGKSNSFMMMPTVADGSIVSCFATVEVEARSRDDWSKLSEDKAQIKQVLVDRHCNSSAEWPEIVERACQQADATSLTIWPYFNAPLLDSWKTESSRVILIGDAAHAMPPTGGQGAAMAFEDAASLAKVLAVARQLSVNELSSRLEAWQAQRHKRVAKVKAFTTKSSDMRKATPSKMQQIMKEYGMWVYFMVKGKDGGLAWIYSHREEGPRCGKTSKESDRS